MNPKITYTKPNGNELEVNNTEANREYAKRNGWKETNRIKVKAEPEKVQQVERQIDNKLL